MKILLVEDHPGLAKISCDLLRDVYGHEVFVAATGSRAAEMAASIAPEIVLLDLHLPDMHGYELATILRRLPGGKTPIIVALTGYGITGDAAQSLAAGIDAHYRKPMDFSELTQLKRRKPERQAGSAA